MDVEGSKSKLFKIRKIIRLSERLGKISWGWALFPQGIKSLWQFMNQVYMVVISKLLINSSIGVKWTSDLGIFHHPFL